jgi:epoxide hydrolase
VPSAAVLGRRIVMAHSVKTMPESPLTPFRVQIGQPEVDDLRDRLVRTRWPGQVPGVGWRRGVPVDYLKDLVDYWAGDYDWRAQESRLNEFSQFTTEIDDQTIHAVHVRSPHPQARPLLLGHGWPGSFVEHLALVGPLTDPVVHGGDRTDAYHVVLPSIPGFGFSQPVGEPGWDVARIAPAYAELMARLGYERFAVHGSDWGALIGRELGRQQPDRVVGVHLTWLPSAVATSEPDPAESAGLTEAERERVRASVDRRARAMAEEMGYGILQSTRPQTLAYALTDSPAGQLAWIIEKFKEWTDCDERPEEMIDRDTLLTNVSLYWFTRSAGSAAGLYYETAHSKDGWALALKPSTVPTGVAVFPRDINIPVRHLGERTDSIQRWSEFDRGGHFPAMEVPDLLLEDLRAFLRSLRWTPT